VGAALDGLIADLLQAFTEVVCCILYLDHGCFL
jgi:hypothetical protein